MPRTGFCVDSPPARYTDRVGDQPISGARAEIAVAATAELAFRCFTERLDEWWPPDYTWSQGALREIGIEPGVDGLCFERGPRGFRCDWGRVLVWEPPSRITLAWHIGPTRVPQPDPANASEVDVCFVRADALTRVTLVHHSFDRHGDGAEEYRAAMDGPGGWDHILARFAQAFA